MSTGLTDSCCNTPATETVWQNKGEHKALHANHLEYKTYRTGPKTATTGIIGVYDVMGYHPTTYQFYDVRKREGEGEEDGTPYDLACPTNSQDAEKGNRSFFSRSPPISSAFFSVFHSPSL